MSQAKTVLLALWAISCISTVMDSRESSPSCHIRQGKTTGIFPQVCLSVAVFLFLEQLSGSSSWGRCIASIASSSNRET